MNEKIVYQADGLGWYVCETVADESPLEPGVFHIPAGCSEYAPPAGPYEDGLWPRLVAGQWVMQLRTVIVEQDAKTKLAAFLAANPDVAAMIEGASPGDV